jgi:5S rRNA maturation endonuclease (ribonuclease M5)
VNLRCVDVVRAVLGEPQKQSGQELLYCCPRHEDRHPSLSINVAKNVWMCGPCNASGTAWALAAFIAQLEPSDKPGLTTWLGTHGLLSRKSSEGKIETIYDYIDRDGKLQFQVVRYHPKDFRQRRPNGNGGFEWNLDDVVRVIYRLTEVMIADNVIVVEGERDVETLREQLRRRNLMGSWAATCNSGGAGKWCSEHSEYLRGKSVYIVCDRDETGMAHGRAVASSVLGIASEARIIERILSVGSKEPKDVSDFIGFGGELSELIHQLDNGLLVTSEVVATWKSLKRSIPSTAAGFDQKPKAKRVAGVARSLTASNLKLSDGRIAEIIDQSGKVVFCVFVPGANTFEAADNVEVAGQTCFPRGGSFVEARAILLAPTPDFSHGEDPNLFDDLCRFVHGYWLGPANWTRLTVLYIMLSWIGHTLDEVPYVRIIGDLGSGKSRFCDVVQVISYRAIRAAGNITAGVLPRALTNFPDATVVVDEADIYGENAQELRLILRSGSSRRTPVLKCVAGTGNKNDWEPASFAVFGPKILAVRRVTKDDALETRCITESVGKTEKLGRVPITLPLQFWEEASALRARLMAFRIVNYGCTLPFREAIADAAEELLGAGFDARTAQLGAPLLALSRMLDHAIACESCLRVLAHYDTSVRLERGQGLDGLLNRFIENLREKGVSKLRLTGFLTDLKTFAAEDDEYDPGFIPKKQSLSRRLNTLAHVLGIRVLPRMSGHDERTILILPSPSKGHPIDSAPNASAPITPTGSTDGAERDQFSEYD